MKTFMSLHYEQILGQITMFDRMIFRGYLQSFYPQGAFQRFLTSQGVLLKEFKTYVPTMTAILRQSLQAIADESKRPLIPLGKTMSQTRGKTKEEYARELAQNEGIQEGLICVLSTLENCMSFEVKGNHESKLLEVVRAPRKCLHYYLYMIDPEFGLMHIRIQSWFPFQIQLYINGREWLGRQMAAKKILYKSYDNTFLEVQRVKEVQQLCRKFIQRKWVRILDAFARRVNPFLPLLRKAGFGSYYWVLYQAEIATDVMFRNRGLLSSLLPNILTYALTAFGSRDVMRFLGKKLNGNYKGELTTDMKERPEGCRIKHRVKGNSIKIYDKWSVLRVETTINQPREFKALKLVRCGGGKPQWQWRPMGKGVANMGRYFQVGSQANERYLEALAQVKQNGKAVEELDGLCRPVMKDGKEFAKLQPLSQTERKVFSAILSTDHVIHGVRNRNVREALYGTVKPDCEVEARRQCARVSRLLMKMRGHGLIYRVKNSSLYRPTKRGYRIMSAILVFYGESFAESYAKAS